MRALRILCLVVAVVTQAGCASSGKNAAPGEEKGNCFPNHTCNAGLTCFSNLCVRFGTDGGGAGMDGAAEGPTGMAGGGGTTGAAGTGAAGVSAAGTGGGAGTAGSSVGGTGGTAAAGSTGAGGTATPTCPTNVDLTTDDNCGGCGNSCVHGRHCAAGRCSPAWLPLAGDGATTVRTRHAAGFVAGKYVVFGGSTSFSGPALASVDGYDLTTGKWTPMAALKSARCSHEAVSTGTTILTFGGLTDCGNGSTVGPGLEQFTPDASTGAWSVPAATGTPPTGRYNFASAWTGKALFVYGGSALAAAVATGGLYSVPGAAWSTAACPLPGCERGGYFSAFFDSGFIHVWGGGNFGNAPAGLSFNPTGNTWSAWTLPAGTGPHLGQRFADDGRRLYYLTAPNEVSIYDRQSSSWLTSDRSLMPTDFCTEAATAWTGTELLAWSGACGVAPVAIGGRYQPPAAPP